MSIGTWIAIFSFFSLFGFFLDWLFQADIRKEDRDAFRVYFRNLYEKTEKTNFGEKQIWVAQKTLTLINGSINHKINYRYFLINTMLISFVFTISLSLIGIYTANHLFFYNTGSIYDFTTIGFRDIEYSKNNGLFFLSALLGNYLFDLMTLFFSYHCLHFLLKKKKLIIVIALIDIIVSFILMYGVLIAGSISSTLHFIPNDLNISDYFQGIFSLFELKHNYTGIIMLFSSMSTFIPVLFYTTFLILLSILRIFQWIFSTSFARFSEETEDEKTFFGWFAVAASAISAFFIMMSKYL